MKNFLLTFVIFCSVAARISAHKTIKSSRHLKGLHYWCERPNFDGINPICCSENYGCDKFVESGKRKFHNHLYNSESYRVRLCKCEYKFENCIKREYPNDLQLMLTLWGNKCLKRTTRHPTIEPQLKNHTTEYSLITYTDYINIYKRYADQVDIISNPFMNSFRMYNL